MNEFIATAVLAAALGTNAFALPNAPGRSLGPQQPIAAPPVLQMQSICVRNTCCHWGNSGDFWACTPR